MPIKRQTFSKAFKAEAVRLLEQSGKPAADLAREFGGAPQPVVQVAGAGGGSRGARLSRVRPPAETGRRTGAAETGAGPGH